MNHKLESEGVVCSEKFESEDKLSKHGKNIRANKGQGCKCEKCGWKDEDVREIEEHREKEHGGKEEDKKVDRYE